MSEVVVNVHADEVVRTQISSGDDLDSFVKDFMSPKYRDQFTTISLGSGVLIDPHHVVTNHHVIARGTRFWITLSDRRDLACKVIGSDADLDLAVLAVQTEEDLPHVEMADSNALMVGETVIAIGNPFGLGHTVTSGVVSALHRTVGVGERTYHDFVQTDASINLGNSGGPLMNVRGELVGINTAVLGPAQGIGFAIPVNRVRRIAPEIIATGGVRQGWLGVELKPINKDLRQRLKLPRLEGLAVVSVDDGGPAAAADIRVDDVILELEGYPILDERHFGVKMRDFAPTTSVPMTIVRDGKTVSVELKAAELPKGFAARVLSNQVGMTVLPLTEARANEIGIPHRDNSFVIKEVRAGSLADEAELSRGDLLIALGSTELDGDPAKLDEALMTARRFGRLDLVLERKGRRSPVVLPL